MNAAIPWYRSPVFIGAVVSIISQLVVLLGLSDQVSSDDIAKYVDAAFQLIALGAAVFAAYKRKASGIQPLTLTKSGADRQSGFASPLMLAVLLACSAVAVVVLPGCAGTKAAYQEAQSPDEYAYVMAEHYASLVRQAADLKENPSTPASAVAAMQRAELAARPLVAPLRPLRDAYLAGQSAETELELQQAIDKAILAIADLVRQVQAARGAGSTTSLLDRKILFEAALIERRAS